MRLALFLFFWLLFTASGHQPLTKSLPPRIAKTVREVLDKPYADTQNPRQRLDLILPSKPASKAIPAIVFIHGGAWRQGNKRSGRRLLTPFVESGRYVGVSVGYRLSQEARWPAQIHDCKAAIRWIRANAKAYGIDPKKIAVWGTSAGGHLVSMLGVSENIEDLEGALGKHTNESSRVTCVANYFGPSALLTMDDFPSSITHNSSDSPESQLIGGPIQEHKEKSQNASPITHVTKDDAPFLHVHGDQDKLVPFNQSQVLDAALDKAGVPSLLITMRDRGHGGFNSPELDTLLQRFFGLYLYDQSFSLEEQTLAPTPAR